jgi:hypothetical protein
MPRRRPEPPARPPRAAIRPGLASGLLAEVAPLLAAEGVDAAAWDAADRATLRRALQRAAERRNLALFTPAGRSRELAAATLRLAAEAIIDGDRCDTTAALGQAQPESPDGTAPTAAGCTGLALSLTDQHLPALPAAAPLPAGPWTGKPAAAAILTLARDGNAFAALGPLITRHGGRNVLHGSALALTAALQAWSRHTARPLYGLIYATIR